MRHSLALLMLAQLLALPVAAEPGPRLTTDTVEYCGSLAARLASLPAAEREPSRSLAAEGRRLCDTGHVRTGIAKLRRAVRAAQAAQAQ
ncbi:hypothetical protein JYK14_19175 [Siccirubricoccus sp. KC 17139]|uniref:Secreted protein n=1 Tax=Siccirubricoccus soli TaxID=2899147 RepID=A0ABT1D8K4_9PROT|nr:hypothetical protein [Siccirubricoccus soli]MCO6418271.1 hypothetical protein [Siccirubricoccus soli]MCP2684406.1 hypothetical protein [Siccirubricoccus soli]